MAATDIAAAAPDAAAVAAENPAERCAGQAHPTGSAPDGPSGGVRQLIAQAMVAITIVALGLALYDQTIRAPSALRLGVVDVSHLYGLAQSVATRDVLEGDAAASALSPSEIARQRNETARAALGVMARTADEFGPRLARTLKELADECACTLVAMAAVYGSEAAITDYTDEAAARLGLAAPWPQGGGRDGADRQPGEARP